ncbi:RNA recognition motif-containing protein [Entophlyctis luteolus]|nr:RNA recognition motif-containing protein [Entophlyctis luteolus]
MPASSSSSTPLLSQGTGSTDAGTGTGTAPSAPVNVNAPSSEKAPASKAPALAPSQQLFVRGIPYSASSADLEAFFSAVVPVRECFVVRDPSAPDRNRGFGYVSFLSHSDAQRAIDLLKDEKFLAQRVLLMEFSRRRNNKSTPATSTADSEQKRQKQQPSELPNPPPTPSTDDGSKKKGKKASTDAKGAHNYTTEKLSPYLLISNLPPDLQSKQLNHKVRKFGPVTDISFPHENDPTKALITYSSPQSAQTAQTRLDNHVFKSYTLTATIAPYTAAPIKPRLIIRNLAFHTTRQHIRDAIESYAHGAAARILHIDMPMRDEKQSSKRNQTSSKKAPNMDQDNETDKQLSSSATAASPKSQTTNRGFAFVVMASVPDARRVISALNGKSIVGRVVAVDWSLPKDEFLKTKVEHDSETTPATVDDGESASGDAEDDDNNGDDGRVDDVDDDGGDDQEDVAQHGGINDSDAESDGDEASDGSAGTHDNVEITLDGETISQIDDEDEYQDAENESDRDSDEDEDDNEDHENEQEDGSDNQDSNHEFGDGVANAERGRTQNQTEDGCTLFVRNLLFETTEEELNMKFSHFGHLRYARITKDSVTGRSRGSGFVCFFNKTDAQDCMAAYEIAVKSHALAEGSQREDVDAGASKATANAATQKRKGSKKDSSSATGTGTQKSMITPEPSLTNAATAPFIIDGRFVNLTLAVSKQESQKLASLGTRDRRKRDARHMYLVKEGVIFPNSNEAVGLLPAEVSKRQKSYTERKRLLDKNPNLFISKTRLSVRNLGAKVSDLVLKRGAVLAVKRFWEDVKAKKRKPLEDEVVLEDTEAGLEPPGRNRRIQVTTAKIMRDPSKPDPSSKHGKSKGFGFIEFAHHSDALACLRYMNANATLFKSDGQLYSAEELARVRSGAIDDDAKAAVEKARRPIVEFALENRLVLKKKEEAAARSREAARDAKRDSLRAAAKEQWTANNDASNGAKGKQTKKRGSADPAAASPSASVSAKRKATAAPAAASDRTDSAAKKQKKQQSNQKQLQQPKQLQNHHQQPQNAPNKPESKKRKAEDPSKATTKRNKALSRSEERDEQDDRAFTQLLAKYGKGLFGPESKILKE